MSAPTTTPTTSGVDRWFELSKRGSTYEREFRGGLVTFFTMAYIVVLNPLIIGTAKDINGLYVGGTEDVVKAITHGVGGDGAGRRRADDPHGGHRPLPDRDRRRAWDSTASSRSPSPRR